ncbi:trypsin-like serine protease [Nitzschia inconspicua]|uniref:Trypsin-like serine protease n=1 Tax=Nitzschia inconspicua TaxID=303405 RepID=A0A9K3PPL9_9STRA|nr:trypsin-like serine protease [Nitzschia inconspicua]
MFLSTLVSAVVMCDAASTIQPYPLKTGPKAGTRSVPNTKVTKFGEIKKLTETIGNNGGVGGQETSIRPEPKVIGGNDADHGEYEYYVQLFYGKTGLLCGGSLIAPNVVLTAAHCFTEDLQYVSVGSYELALTYGVENGYSQHAGIADIAIHPSYDGYNSFEYDIMLLKLDESFTQFKPLSLNFDDSLPRVGDAVTVIGLGLTDAQDYDSVSNVLQELNLEIIPTEECFPPGSELNDIVNGETEFCASNPGKTGGQDSCLGEYNPNMRKTEVKLAPRLHFVFQYVYRCFPNLSDDSGGPIFSLDSSGEHIQMGVVSWGGYICAEPGEGGVYSRVSTSQDFILSAVCGEFGVEGSFCSNYTHSDSGIDSGSGSDNSDGGTESSTGGGCSGESSNGNTAEGMVSCSSFETYFIFKIRVDAYGSEVSWDLSDDQGYVIYSDSGFADGETRLYEGCLSQTASACYHLSIYDSYGDGMGYAYNDEDAYIGVIFGHSSFTEVPEYKSQFTLELCH